MAVKGLKSLSSKLSKKLPQQVRRRIKEAVTEGARDIVATQKNLAPVKSGALRDSIGYTFGAYKPDNANVRGVGSTSGGDDLTVTIHAGDKDAWYAALVEFGTSPHVIKPTRPGGLLNISGRLIDKVDHPGADAHPFFYPGYRANKRNVKAKVRRAIRKGIKEVAGS